MVLAPTSNRMPLALALRRGLEAGVRLAAVLLVLCGLAGGVLHVHHGAGSESCAVCVHARTPATTTAIVALPIPVQPSGEPTPSAEVAFEPAPCAANTDSRAPPSGAPSA